eukprot:GFYU01007560.1.p1 GENE.GFYU01007560.1~~GFYU01007560.1.p1  ORF type:complete len:524 (-),score=125.88 GFYU01007560.1:3-1574(-)
MDFPQLSPMSGEPLSPSEAPLVYTHAWMTVFGLKSRPQQLGIITYRDAPWPYGHPVAARHLAAMIIQAYWRAFLGRRLVVYMTADKVKMDVVVYLKALTGLLNIKPQRPPHLKKLLPRKKIRRAYRMSPQAVAAQGGFANADTWENFCASKIQVFWKTILKYRAEDKKAKDDEEKEMKKFQATGLFADVEVEPFMHDIAAHSIQMGWYTYQKMGIVKRLEDKNNIISQHLAADVVRRCWLRYTNIKIYQYYRDLIKFRERGDPALMLKCVNPGEANLAEKASGVHVRFRLGGEGFPPTIFYKIYTHSPVIDVNAFAPRHYYKTNEKRGYKGAIDPLKQHNKGHGAPVEPTDGWYTRFENNGWRPVSESMLADVGEIHQVKPVKFHYKKLMRKEKLEQLRKEKQVQWMKKMYAEGRSQQISPHTDTSRSVSGLKAWNDDDDALDEDALLNWTDTLDFDKYHQNWLSLATTGRSDNKPDLDNLEATAMNYIDEYYSQYLENPEAAAHQLSADYGTQVLAESMMSG